MVFDRSDLPLFMNVNDLAEAMRINTTKAYQLVKVEGFPAIKLGKRIIIPKEAFLDWLGSTQGQII